MKIALVKKANTSWYFNEAAEILGFTGHARIRRLVKKLKRKTETTEGLVGYLTNELCEQIQENKGEVTSTGHDILSYVKKKRRKHPERCRLMLLDVLDILATYNVQDRQLVREILHILFNYLKIIDREVFLFRYSKYRHFDIPVDDLALDAKQEYILSMVAGWKVPWADERCQHLPMRFYLEQQFRCEDCVSTSHIMSEALYRLQNPTLVLRLLQHGVSPSAVLLWPITIVSEMLCNMGQPVRATSYEMTIIRYFCRARNHFTLSALPSSELVRQRREQLIQRFQQQPDRNENTLLVSHNTKALFPAERHSTPAELVHQCRTAIRRALHDADQLPRGIALLGLPRVLRDYVALLTD